MAPSTGSHVGSCRRAARIPELSVRGKAGGGLATRAPAHAGETGAVARRASRANAPNRRMHPVPARAAAGSGDPFPRGPNPSGPWFDRTAMTHAAPASASPGPPPTGRARGSSCPGAAGASVDDQPVQRGPRSNHARAFGDARELQAELREVAGRRSVRRRSLLYQFEADRKRTVRRHEHPRSQRVPRGCRRGCLALRGVDHAVAVAKPGPKAGADATRGPHARGCDQDQPDIEPTACRGFGIARDEAIPVLARCTAGKLRPRSHSPNQVGEARIFAGPYPEPRLACPPTCRRSGPGGLRPIGGSGVRGPVQRGQCAGEHQENVIRVSGSRAGHAVCYPQERSGFPWPRIARSSGPARLPIAPK